MLQGDFKESLRFPSALAGALKHIEFSKGPSGRLSVRPSRHPIPHASLLTFTNSLPHAIFSKHSHQRYYLLPSFAIFSKHSPTRYFMPSFHQAITSIHSSTIETTLTKTTSAEKPFATFSGTILETEVVCQ